MFKFNKEKMREHRNKLEESKNKLMSVILKKSYFFIKFFKKNRFI